MGAANGVLARGRVVRRFGHDEAISTATDDRAGRLESDKAPTHGLVRLPQRLGDLTYREGATLAVWRGLMQGGELLRRQMGAVAGAQRRQHQYGKQVAVMSLHAGDHLVEQKIRSHAKSDDAG